MEKRKRRQPYNKERRKGLYLYSYELQEVAEALNISTNELRRRLNEQNSGNEGDAVEGEAWLY